MFSVNNLTTYNEQEKTMTPVQKALTEAIKVAGTYGTHALRQA